MYILKEWAAKTLLTLIAMLVALTMIIFCAAIAITSFQQISSIETKLHSIEKIREQDNRQGTFDFLIKLAER